MATPTIGNSVRNCRRYYYYYIANLCSLLNWRETAFHCQFTLQDANRTAAVGGVKLLLSYVTWLLLTAWCAARFVAQRVTPNSIIEKKLIFFQNDNQFLALSWISPLRGFKKIRPKYGKIAHYVLTIMDIADVKIYTIIVPYSYSIRTHISSMIGFTNNSWAY